ncbi:MAG: hypothetical protein ACI8XC_000750 [Gammaproteobacteria bacterium]
MIFLKIFCRIWTFREQMFVGEESLNSISGVDGSIAQA